MIQYYRELRMEVEFLTSMGDQDEEFLPKSKVNY
jgi:hypothetical protein